MGAPGSPQQPGSTSTAAEPGQASEQMDAMDRMDDDGSPENEASHADAVKQMEHAHENEASTPRVETAPADTASHPPHAPTASEAPQAPQPAPLPASGSADPDAQ